MITIIAAVVGLLTLGCLIGELVWRCMTRQSRFTPGRRTRGFARWWARCWRWMRIIRPERDVKVRIPKAHAPTLAELYPTVRGQIVVKTKGIGGRSEAMLTQEDIRTLNAKFITDGVAAWRRR